ncbi:hypothetical protein EXIGLDRAFT_411407 [Exidia glandulosa HHB12029]|uniref:Uncharacterized protein n=1 Tax=Exidia glandulosa HHB12029 TaxID=1314781 RepID=A0A165KPF7_EXIGL|nr:hypothetical protein EXIGLDRAFT_411407 [Exidia glandulosa HHB12029]
MCRLQVTRQSSELDVGRLPPGCHIRAAPQSWTKSQARWRFRFQYFEKQCLFHHPLLKESFSSSVSVDGCDGDILDQTTQCASEFEDTVLLVSGTYARPPSQGILMLRRKHLERILRALTVFGGCRVVIRGRSLPQELYSSRGTLTPCRMACRCVYTV